MNEKSKEYIIYIVFIVGVISSFLIILHDKKEPFPFLWLLPLIYSLLFFISNLKFAIFNYLGVFILNLIMFLRYVILPLHSTFTGIYFHSNTINTSDLSNRISIFLMIYEMICIAITIHFLTKRLDNNRKRIYKYKLTDIQIEKKFPIYYLAVIIGVFAFIIFPQIRERVNFLFVKEIASSNLNALASLAYLFAINIFKIIFIIVIINESYKSQIGKQPHKTLIFIVTFLCIIFIASGNRTTIIVQALACIAILRTTHLINKKMLFFLSIITILVVLSLTSYRLFSRGELNILINNNQEYFDEQLVQNYLQSYLGGYHLISIAIQTKPAFSGDIQTFINEIISSIIFVRQVFPLSISSTTVIFNNNFGFIDQPSMILPSLGQGYYYFGFIGAPLLSVFFCYLLYRSENALINANSLGVKFAFYVLTSWIALFPLQNLNIITSTIFNLFFPFYLIAYFNYKAQKLKI